MSKSLKEKIDSGEARVGIVGLGYVGLPLALDLARSGFAVTGFDISTERTNAINNGKSYIGDVSDADLNLLRKTETNPNKGSLKASVDFSEMAKMDVISICVPTPLGKTKDPDISYILAVRDELAKTIHPEMLLILESTTYPGTTEEIFVPAVEKAGLEIGKNFFLVFSPERIDPGNKDFEIRTTPKVVGGMTKACTEMAVSLYKKILDTPVPVSSTRVAEMVKLLENTFRAVNIGLVNEVALMCNVLGINTWEVIEAAATKPFGFTPFYPGPGLGGHCIPVDPHYLSWKLKTLNYHARFIELASEVNTGMPHHVVTLAQDTLNDYEKSLRGSKVLILGVAYKASVSDTRESPALDINGFARRQRCKINLP